MELSSAVEAEETPVAIDIDETPTGKTPALCYPSYARSDRWFYCLVEQIRRVAPRIVVQFLSILTGDSHPLSLPGQVTDYVSKRDLRAGDCERGKWEERGAYRSSPPDTTSGISGARAI